MEEHFHTQIPEIKAVVERVNECDNANVQYKKDISDPCIKCSSNNVSD